MSSPFAPVYEAVLDDEEVTALFADIATLGESVEISSKSSPTERSDATRALSLASAREALLRREVRAVQLRYIHEGKRWCDTLLTTSAGTRIVRMEQPG